MTAEVQSVVKYEQELGQLNNDIADLWPNGGKLEDLAAGKSTLPVAFANALGRAPLPGAGNGARDLAAGVVRQRRQNLPRRKNERKQCERCERNAPKRTLAIPLSYGHAQLATARRRASPSRL